MIWFLPFSCLFIGGIGLLAYEFNPQMTKDQATFYILAIMVIASIPLSIAAKLYSNYKRNKWKNYLWDKLMNDDDFYGHCLDCWKNKMGAAFGSRDDYFVVPTEMVEKAIEARELFLPKQVKSVKEGYFNTMFG